VARTFDITDIVTTKGNDDVLFMVVDYADYSGLAPNGKEIEDIDYELIQIYPIQKNGKYVTMGQPDLNLKEKQGNKNHELLLSFIQKDREKKGWFGVPDFIELANRNLKSIQRAEGKQVKEVKPPMQKLDSIRYDQIDTIDKCLQAINDLNTLHKMFGDESYLQLKEVVTARIIRLNK
jgi:hypothetical protein